MMQVDPIARPVDEGSVLCLAADRHPLGRIEEVFGPIHAPLYALRYAGGGETPPGLAVGAAVSSVERFNEYLMPEAVQVRMTTLGIVMGEHACAGFGIVVLERCMVVHVFLGIWWIKKNMATRAPMYHH